MALTDRPKLPPFCHECWPNPKKPRTTHCECTTGYFRGQYKDDATSFAVDNLGNIPHCPTCGFGLFVFKKGNKEQNIKNLEECFLKQHSYTYNKEKQNASCEHITEDAQP